MKYKSKYKSFYLSDATKKKLVAAKKKMENALNDNNLTWESFFNILTSNFLDVAENSFQKVFDSMRENEARNRINFAEFREQIEKFFETQNNNIEELVGAVLKQNNSAEVLQKLQSVERQNENISLDVKAIEEFNSSVNNDYKELISSLKTLLANFGNMSETLSQKITEKTRRYFGIAVAFIMHHIIRDNNLLIKKSSNDETVKEVNLVVSNYRKLYNSTGQYSDEDVEKFFDRYSMKDQLK